MKGSGLVMSAAQHVLGEGSEVTWGCLVGNVPLRTYELVQ